MRTSRYLLIAALGSAACAVPALGSTIPVNGTWVGHREAPMCAAGGGCVARSPQDLMYKLQGKVLSRLRYSVSVTCGEGADDYDVYFTGGAGLPPGTRLNSRDALTVTFTDTDTMALDRVGTVTMTITYRGARPMASFRITTTNGTTPCVGDMRQIPLRLSIIGRRR